MNFDCPVDTIFQQDGAPAHTARATQNWLQTNCPDFIVASKFTRLEPPWITMSGGNVGGLSQAPSKPKTIAELKEVLQVIRDSLPQGPIDKAVKDFSKRLKACVAAEGGHFEHSQ